MLVVGIGNVTSVTKSYIFVRGEDKQYRIPVNLDDITKIVNTCINDISFYWRMYEELLSEYERVTYHGTEKYQYITKESLDAVLKTDGKGAYLEKSWVQDIHNAKCTEYYNTAFGICESAYYAFKKYEDANKLYDSADVVYKYLMEEL